jgi:hypothetical protein
MGCVMLSSYAFIFIEYFSFHAFHIAAAIFDISLSIADFLLPALADFAFRFSAFRYRSCRLFQMFRIVFSAPQATLMPFSAISPISLLADIGCAG